ncbi:putative ankyrin repeat domain-containing protein 20A12 [Heliangelus exortis]|uniref:putative ankyrin repeat domain-containing protein 20A12 n=1 Tax=Heliangelus exortis TaxID=472823 RepID=UPI003A944D37
MDLGISAAAEKEVIKDAIENSVVQEQLAQAQRENLLLRQQLEDRKQQLTQESVVTVAQDFFNDIFKNLKADTEQKVYLLEEKNKELYENCNVLRKQVFRCEVDKVEAQCKIRVLQQELADALKKLSMVEASLDVATCYRRNLEEATLGLKKELAENKSKLQELEEHLQHEHSICDLKIALENKEREKRDCFQRLEDLLLASSGRTIAMKHLEGRIQCLEAKNARLQATVVQQNSTIETLLQGSPLEQAASQDRMEEIRAHDHEAERKLLLSRMGDLKQELESEKYTLRESIVLKEKYEKLYLEEVKKRRWLQNELERADDELPKANTALHEKGIRRSISVTSSLESRILGPSPAQLSTHLGHPGKEFGTEQESKSSWWESSFDQSSPSLQC